MRSWDPIDDEVAPRRDDAALQWPLLLIGLAPRAAGAGKLDPRLVLAADVAGTVICLVLLHRVAT